MLSPIDDPGSIGTMTGGYQPAKAHGARDDRSEECYLPDFRDTLFSAQHG